MRTAQRFCCPANTPCGNGFFSVRLVLLGSINTSASLARLLWHLNDCCDFVIFLMFFFFLCAFGFDSCSVFTTGHRRIVSDQPIVPTRAGETPGRVAAALCRLRVFSDQHPGVSDAHMRVRRLAPAGRAAACSPAWSACVSSFFAFLFQERTLKIYLAPFC